MCRETAGDGFDMQSTNFVASTAGLTASGVITDLLTLSRACWTGLPNVIFALEATGEAVSVLCVGDFFSKGETSNTSSDKFKESGGEGLTEIVVPSFLGAFAADSGASASPRESFLFLSTDTVLWVPVKELPMSAVLAAVRGAKGFDGRRTGLSDVSRAGSLEEADTAMSSQAGRACTVEPLGGESIS